MNDADRQAWLDRFLRDHGGVSGTVHVRPPDGDLSLAAAVNIPPPVQEIVRRIPIGKGMAGLAWERNEPVSTCNIKDDRSGEVRPGALPAITAPSSCTSFGRIKPARRACAKSP